MVCCYYNVCELTVALFGSVSVATVLICQHWFIFIFSLFFCLSLNTFFIFTVFVFFTFFSETTTKMCINGIIFYPLMFYAISVLFDTVTEKFFYAICYNICYLISHVFIHGLSALVLFIAIFKTSQTLIAESWQDSTISSHKFSTNNNFLFLRKCE